MNYFDLFGIPVQLKVDAGSLSKKFFELSKKYHPDYFVKKDEMAQGEALERSALLNKAYKTFQKPDETIKYVLQLKGLVEEEEKYELPPDFLMEVLEINERLMDREQPAAGSQELADAGLQMEVENLYNKIYEPVKGIIEDYKEGATTEKELLQVKQYYYKKKYLDRIRRQLGQMT
jgi:molecular chaperone HscB